MGVFISSVLGLFGAVIFIILIVNAENRKSERRSIIAKWNARKKDFPVRGKFDVTGFSHLPSSTRRKLRNEAKEGDSVELSPWSVDQDEQAVKVFWKDIDIGWVSKEYRHKAMLKEALDIEVPTKAWISFKKNIYTGSYHHETGEAFIDLTVDFEIGNS